MSAAQIDLLADASATGSPTRCALGGRYLMSSVGTHGGGSVSVEILSPDGTTYVGVENASLSNNGTKVIYLPWNSTIRGAVAGGSPSGLYLSLYRMEG